MAVELEAVPHPQNDGEAEPRPENNEAESEPCPGNNEAEAEPKIRTYVTNYPPDAEVVYDDDGCLVIGLCAFFYTHPDRPGQIIKVPKSSPTGLRDFEIEKRVWRRLREHPHLVKVIDIDEYGMYLELASNGSLRSYYQKGDDATLGEKVTWSLDVAQVLEYVHQKNVRHCDLSGRNLLLDSSRKIILCDFSGSYIDGEKATIIAEVGFRHPDEDEHSLPTLRAELHTLGSLLYEIVTCKKPYEGLVEEVVFNVWREENIQTLATYRSET